MCAQCLLDVQANPNVQNLNNYTLDILRTIGTLQIIELN